MWEASKHLSLLAGLFEKSRSWMKILSFQSWHQICSWDEHSLCQHPWAPASPCQQASCEPCGGRSSVSGQRIGRHQKQLPERAWVSEISLPHIKSRKRRSIPSESCLPVPQLNSKHRGWAKNWFVVLPQSLCSSRDISTPNQEQNLGWNSLYLHLWEHLCPSTFCPFGVPWVFPSSLREESPLLLQPFTQPALSYLCSGPPSSSYLEIPCQLHAGLNEKKTQEWMDEAENWATSQRSDTTIAKQHLLLSLVPMKYICYYAFLYTWKLLFL